MSILPSIVSKMPFSTSKMSKQCQISVFTNVKVKNPASEIHKLVKFCLRFLKLERCHFRHLIERYVTFVVKNC